MYDLQQWANYQNKHQSATIRLFSRPLRATSTQSMQAIQTSHTRAYARRVWMYCNWCFTSLQHKLPLHACDLRLWNSSYFGALKCTRYLLEVCPASTIVCNTFMQTCHIDQTWHRTIAGASKRCFLVATGLRLAQESCHRQDCTISGQGNSASNHWATPSKALIKLQMPEWRPSNWQSEDIKGLDYAPLHVAARHWFFFWAFAVPRLCFFWLEGWEMKSAASFCWTSQQTSTNSLMSRPWKKPDRFVLWVSQT